MFKALVLLVAFFGQTVIAAPNKAASKADINKFITSGNFYGGSSGKGFSLLNVKRVLNQAKTAERVIFEIGDFSGSKFSGKPGYYQAQLQANPPRLSIDFSQMSYSKVDAAKFSEMFKNSKLVKKTKMTLDPEDRATNLTIYFKEPIKARIYSLAPKEKSPKVVVDFSRLK